MTAMATLEAAKAALLTAIDDSRTEYAGDAILDVVEEMVADDLIARCEAYAKAEQFRQGFDELFATVKTVPQ